MSESMFSKAAAAFATAKARVWTPETKTVVYAAQAGATLGLAIGSAAMGQVWLSSALLSAVVRSGIKVYQANMERRKAAFGPPQVLDGITLTGDALYRELGRMAGEGLAYDEARSFNAGVNRALLLARAGNGTSSGAVSLSEVGIRGFKLASAVGSKAGPKAAEAYVAGVQAGLESRRPPHTAKRPPLAVIRAATTGSSGGVARLISAIGAITLQVDKVRGHLSASATVLDDFLDEYESSIGSSSTGSDVIEALRFAGDAVEEAGSLLSKVVELAGDYSNGLSDL